MALPNTTDMVLEYGFVLLRAQRLGANCAPLTGANDRIVTAGAISLTASPEIKEGDEFQWITGGGTQIAEVKRDDKIRRWTLTGEISTPDLEFKQFLFGGELILGDTGTAYVGDTVGYAYPDLSSPNNNGIYLEVIGQLAYEGAGDCVDAATAPGYMKHIFTRVKVTPGDVTLGNDIINLSFTGVATANPTAALDPFGDYTGVGSVPNKPYVEEQIAATLFDAAIADAAPGTQSAA